MRYGDARQIPTSPSLPLPDLTPPRPSCRYVFLHNRVCDHLFVVSDIRLEPVPAASAPPNNPVAGPADATAAAAATTTYPAAGFPAHEYPRLSFRAKPNSRRCGICQTKTAVKMSVGHPLSDKVS